MLLLALLASAAAAAGPTPLACQPNEQFPMLPTFHIIGNVTQATPGAPIKLEPINDCSGVTYYQGIYHVWHQCCQNHWDHVISKDLIHWQRLPPPIQPVTLKTWDGSISMFDAEDGGPIILYDAQDGKLGPWSSRNLSAPLDRPILGVARLADPNDKYLNVWTRVENNPVEFIGKAAAFPGQIWKNGDYFNMIMQGDRYQSNDSKFHTWTNQGPMIGKGEHGGQWWIPVPNEADGTPAPPEVGNYIVNVGGGDSYEFGQYDPEKETFTPTNVSAAKLEGGHGGWWGAQQANERMMMIGWALGDFHGDAGPGINFLTRLTLLREVHYEKKSNNLVSNPVPELVNLRTSSIASGVIDLQPNTPHAVSGTEGGAAASADINITFSGVVKDGTTFGVCVLGNSSGEGLGISIFVKEVNNEFFATVTANSCSESFQSQKETVPVERLMNNTDLGGGDFSVTHHDAAYGFQGCQAACDASAECVAWTWVVRGPDHEQGAGDCCLKKSLPCPAARNGMYSGVKKASPNATCGGGGGGHHPAGNPAGIPLFDETEINVRITPDRSLADFFVQGGRWSGSVAWLSKTPRAAGDSQVNLWADTSGVTADVDVFAMGCGWEYPSFTANPTL